MANTQWFLIQSEQDYTTAIERYEPVSYTHLDVYKRQTGYSQRICSYFPIWRMV